MCARISSARVISSSYGPLATPTPRTIERNRPHPFVRIGFDVFRLEHGDRPIADVVVQLLERSADDPLGFFPRAALGQNRLQRAAQKQRPPQLRVRLMPQQVAMKLPIGGEQILVQQFDDRAGLANVAERAPLPFELVHPPRQPVAQHRDGIALSPASARQPPLDAGYDAS